MPKFGQSDSKYLAKTDLMQDDGSYRTVLLTMDRLEEKTLKTESGDEEEKLVLFFQNVKKGLVLNIENMEKMSELYEMPANISAEGATLHFHGKKIALWVNPNVRFGKKKVGGLRLAAPPEQVQHSSEPTPPPMEEPPPPLDEDNPFD